MLLGVLSPFYLVGYALSFQVSYALSLLLIVFHLHYATPPTKHQVFIQVGQGLSNNFSNSFLVFQCQK